VFTRLAIAQADVEFGRCRERSNNIFAFVQRVHAFDLDRHRPLQRSVDEPARDKISRIKGMSRNRTAADLVVRRRLLSSFLDPRLGRS
jgi:hypothetical protein